ncbi:MAG: hypothetical protein Q7Q71_15440 [Verrucomicrobiota bacterium JB023]|nr:hypothetical protein [Verrucomicrobiota bacterium JB023]
MAPLEEAVLFLGNQSSIVETTGDGEPLWRLLQAGIDSDGLLEEIPFSEVISEFAEVVLGDLLADVRDPRPQEVLSAVRVFDEELTSEFPERAGLFSRVANKESGWEAAELLG